MTNPTDMAYNLKTQASSVILEMLYGYTTKPSGRDPLVGLADKMMSEMIHALATGAWMVDIFPWLRYLPEWLPGMGFKKTSRAYKQTAVDAANTPFDFTVRQRVQRPEGVKPSYVSGLLDDDPSEHERNLIKYSALSLYSAAADTTASTIHAIFLAMTLFPEVQKKAQDEIDRVVGNERLPEFEDREKLPYISAIVKEALRWWPATPLGLPHSTDVDREFKNYHIPKGSIILASVGWFCKDPSIYKEPELFKPERFLGPDPELDPHYLAFGFGRRICPGRYLADGNIFITAAQILAAFNIRKAVDPATGMLMTPIAAATPGLIAYPVPFKCSVTPRSEKYKELVSRVDIEYPCGDGDAGLLPNMKF
ncbi:hypothetical protein ABW21_db0202253 [Orbilia brochopaga]|nr:hypothetical protein ABW21_db0202253 [Drechslerella brochopaga]